MNVSIPRAANWNRLSEINISGFFNALHPLPRADGQQLLTPVPISS
jgi:hypothetical protein